MKTKRTITKTLWNSLLIIFLGTLLAGQAHGQIFVTNSTSGTVGEYDAATGATINSALVSGLNGPTGIAVSGGNLWVGNYFAGTIGEYNATTGATVNASLVSGLSHPFGIAVSGGNLFVTDYSNGSIGEYDATTGATINASLVSGLNQPFGIAVAEPYTAQVQQPINPDGSSVFSVRRGVIPVKFTLTQDGVATCALPPATIALTRTAGGTTGAIDESVYSGSADTGSNFRIDSCQYIYNVSASALGAGTYRVDIVIDGQVVGSGSFQLK